MAIKQISVFLENRSGRLWELCDALGRAGINMRALSIGEAADFGVIRMIVNNPEDAIEKLNAAGFTAKVTDVLAVEIPDVPGGLAGVLAALKDKDMNIEYAYAFVVRSGEKAIVSLRVEDPVAAEAALTAAGFSLVGAEQLYTL